MIRIRLGQALMRFRLTHWIGSRIVASRLTNIFLAATSEAVISELQHLDWKPQVMKPQLVRMLQTECERMVAGLYATPRVMPSPDDAAQRIIAQLRVLSPPG